MCHAFAAPQASARSQDGEGGESMPPVRSDKLPSEFDVYIGFRVDLRAELFLPPRLPVVPALGGSQAPAMRARYLLSPA